MTTKRFLIVTHVKHTCIDGNYFAYGPYVREMNLWINKTEQVVIVAPLSKDQNNNPIDIQYTHPNIRFVAVPAFQLTDVVGILRSLWVVPYIMITLLVTMSKASHIHLRCPGNMGLLGSIMQLFFPLKKKTAKYAGNWDWKSKQPFTYRIQQYILRNTFLSHNIQTLVYGEWPDRTKNILPFFTASYTNQDRRAIPSKTISTVTTVKLMFVGALAEGKNPLKSLKVAALLKEKGMDVEIHFYGEGILRKQLEEQIIVDGMQNQAYLHGNVNSHELQKAYQQHHFMVLLSESEGWPKAVAEAMWWGCVPVTSPVSCVPWMLAEGKRGILISGVHDATEHIKKLILSPDVYAEISHSALKWSRHYTLELFESRISSLLSE
jgi:glycosyltransferase involved in cell wall biosynthesis